MTEPKVTGWYSGDQTPARKGLYQRYRPIGGGQVVWSYWTGRRWGFVAFKPEDAVRHKDIFSAFQRLLWRGLADKP